MKILKFTNTIGACAIRGVLLLVLLLGVSANTLFANDCSMVCAGDLNAPVDAETCETTISYLDLIPNPCFDDGYIVKILNLNNQELYSDNSSVTVELLGRYIYKVGHEINGQDVYCWGYITFEDKKAPIKNLQEDEEPETMVCGVLSEDPSGVDDLATEIVSCVVKEEHGDNALEPWFDVLDKGDFKDCTGVKDVYNFTDKYDLCKDDIPSDVEDEVDASHDIPNGWEACYVYKRSWFAADKTGRLSDTCSQYVIVVRPKQRRIKIDENPVAECGEDEAEVLAQGYPYFYDLDNDGDFVTCPRDESYKVILAPGTHTCKYASSVHYDEKVKLCDTDGTKVYKLVGHWTVVDWCTGKPIKGNGQARDLFDEFTSTLKVEDTTAPEADGLSSYTSHASLFDCTGEINVGPQKFIDCVGIKSVKTIAEYIVDGDDPHSSRFERIESETNGITLDNVPLNVVIQITYIAVDSCDNEGRSYNEVFIEDDRAPVCIANDELNVSMIRLDPTNADSLGARIYGEDIDDTSRDNCYPLIFEVRRAEEAAASNDPDTLWAEYVEFTKADLTDGGCRGEHKIELRVTEDRGAHLSPALKDENRKSDDEHYLSSALLSTCWSTVILEDKNPAILDIEEAKVAKCTDPMPEFDVLDIAGCYDGVDMHIDTLYDNECDYVEILRLRKVWNPYRLHDGVKQYQEEVTQEIIIENDHDTKFTFPIDVKTDCAMAAIPEPTPIEDIIDENGCANWLMQVEDTEFTTTDDDACRKILRRYTFINWCTWDPSNTELAVVRRPEDGVKTLDDQVILHYRDADLDGVNDIDDADDGDAYDIETSEHGDTTDGAWVQIDNGDFVQGETTYNHTEDIRNKRVTSVDGYNYGYFSYIQVIKIQDNEDPVSADPVVKVSCDPSNIDCDFPTKVQITLGGSDNCSDLSYETYLQPFQEGDFIHDIYGDLNGNVIIGYYPVGTHNLIVKTSDACGNAVQDTIELVVTPECKKPTPVCRAAFTATMEDGTVNIWASDIESGSSSDNCSAYEDLTFTIALIEDINDDDVIDALDVVAVSDTNVITLTCDNVGTSLIALWATDEAGNTQYCLVPVNVTDNSLVCLNQESKVAGKIVNENDEEVDQVTVSVESPGMNRISSIFNGFFDIINLPMQRDITVSASKDLGYLNGVSTADLVVLQRHVLGISTLNSPYKIIAADANNDANVDTRDMLQLSRLILGIYEEFPANTSWKFVAKEHVFTNPTSPWGYPESLSFDHVDEATKADFIGVKVGDVTGNAIPSNLLGNDDETAIRTISFATKSQILEAGKESTISISAADMNDVSGYQFSLQLEEGTVFNGLTFGDDSQLSETNFGLTKLDENIITVSWASSEAIDFISGTELFGLNVTTATSAHVESVLQLNSAFTPAEAYDNDLSKLDIKLKIQSDNDAFELYQNVPNPVSNETTIGFNLPEAGKASLKIMDVAGRVLKQVDGEFVKGYNTIILDRSDLGSAGVLYYQLDANQSSASKKMIIID